MISSCKKNDPVSEVQYTYLNKSLKSNFTFNEGSYWVYQNQTMQKDSVVLTNSKTGFTSTCPGNDCSKSEFIALTFNNVTRGTSFNHYLISSYIKYNGGGAWGQYGQPIYITGENLGYEFNGLVVGEKLDSLLVMNVMYYNVEKMSVNADEQFQHVFEFNRDFYFVPSIGIVKQVIYDTINGTETWELKSSRIK